MNSPTLTSTLLVCLALSPSLLVACSESPAADDDSSTAGSSSGGGDSTTGGASTGGRASGGTSSGGSAAGGTSATEPPDLHVEFDDESGFHVVSKSELIPGATATLASDANASDGHAIALTVPGNAAFGEDDYVGPGAHAIEIAIDGSDQLYGRYEVAARFPECGTNEELVSGIFTYFNDGSDEDEDGVSDNSEIDIEHLCGDPKFLWFTVWTDYQGAPTEQFARTSRLIDMRTGAVQQTELGGTSWGGLSPAGSIDGLALADFPNPDVYYHLGFEWTASAVRYFLIHEGREIELWTLEGTDYVPQRPAEFLINLWHPGEHWSKAGAADFPANDATLRLDWVKIWKP